MQRLWLPLTLSSLLMALLLSLAPAQPAQAVPLQQAATETPTGTTTTTTTATTTTTVTTTPGTATPTTTPTTTPTSVLLANSYLIAFLGFTSNADGTTTWSYQVDELAGAQDLSNWVLGLPGCVVAGASPEPNEVVNPDPNAQINGVKWQTGAGFTSGVFTVTLANASTVGAVVAAAKGPDVEYGTLQGPDCGAYQGIPPRPDTIPIIYVLSLDGSANDARSIRYMGLSPFRTTAGQYEPAQPPAQASSRSAATRRPPPQDGRRAGHWPG